MRPQDLLNRLDDMPFRPFRIHLSDGTVMEVGDPRLVMVGRSTAVLATGLSDEGNGHKIAEGWRTIALMHITQFSDLEPASA